MTLLLTLLFTLNFYYRVSRPEPTSVLGWFDQKPTGSSLRTGPHWWMPRRR